MLDGGLVLTIGFERLWFSSGRVKSISFRGTYYITRNKLSSPFASIHACWFSFHIRLVLVAWGNRLDRDADKSAPRVHQGQHANH